MEMKGIDVSGWNDVSVYDKYKPNFCMIKATEGVGYVSDGLDKHIKAYQDFCTRDNRIPCMGFYHYARPETGNSAKAEVDSFMAAVGKYKGTALYALDWEGDAVSVGTQWAVDFIEELARQSGSTPFIYMSSSITRQYDWSKLPMEKCRLWVAHWGVDKPTVASWPAYSMWQYSDEGVDRDLFKSGPEAWYKLAKANYPEGVVK